jgi:predicted aconitase with swiveling domain
LYEQSAAPATIFFNECSQIPYSSAIVALTPLAQVVRYIDKRGVERVLKQRTA